MTVASMAVVTRFQRINHLVGETAREGGLLMLVLGPLESALAERPLNPAWLVTVIVAGFTCIACRILLEAGDQCD